MKKDIINLVLAVLTIICVVVIFIGLKSILSNFIADSVSLNILSALITGIIDAISGVGRATKK